MTTKNNKAQQQEAQQQSSLGATLTNESSQSNIFSHFKKNKSQGPNSTHSSTLESSQQMSKSTTNSAANLVPIPPPEFNLDVALAEFSSVKTGALDKPDKRFVEVAYKYNDEQLREITKEYYSKNRRSLSQLVKEIVKDQDTEDLCLAVIAPKHHAWAYSINTSFADLVNNSDLLITSILSMSIQDIKQTKLQYKLHFGQTLDDAYAQTITGDKFWMKLCKQWLKRDHGSAICNRYNVDADAERLENATKGSGTDLQTYISIFCTTTEFEFKQILEKYKQNAGEDFSTSLRGEFEVGSLDYYAATLVIESLKGIQPMAKFIFDACFTEKNGDKPMLSFLISQFRDRIDLSKIPGAQAKIKKEISVFKANTYLFAVLTFFGLKE